MPAEDVIDEAKRTSKRTAAKTHRRASGIPEEGSFAVDIANVQQQIQELNLPIKNAATAETSLSDARVTAKKLADQDPSIAENVANFKELDALYKEAKKNASNLTRQRAELQKKLDNLVLADAYETLEDASVLPIKATTMMEKLPYAVRQFYPGLKEAAKRDEMSYTAKPEAVKDTGIVDAAKQFYDDVLEGNISKDKAATYQIGRAHV